MENTKTVELEIGDERRKRTTKFTPVLSDRNYYLKLVAIVGDDTRIYTYRDDEGDQMLVRNFGDRTMAPYIIGNLSLKQNPRTGRHYTKLEILGPGYPNDELGEIEIPESWKVGKVKEGEALRKELLDSIDEAIYSVEYLGRAADDCEARIQRFWHDGTMRPARKTVEAWQDRAEEDAREKCEPFFTEDIGSLRKMRAEI